MWINPAHRQNVLMSERADIASTGPEAMESAQTSDTEQGGAEAKRSALILIEQCGTAMVGSIGPDGNPWIKAMVKVEAEGLQTIWFSTNTSSSRVNQYLADPRASVYFVNVIDYKGLLLLGEMSVLTDRESRRRVWRYGNEIYYPNGIEDPDYAVLRFTATSGNYYHNLKNSTFTI